MKLYDVATIFFSAKLRKEGGYAPPLLRHSDQESVLLNWVLFALTPPSPLALAPLSQAWERRFYSGVSPE